MSTPGFQVFRTPDGNLTVADGIVCQLKTGVRIAVGSSDATAAIVPDLQPGDYTPAAGAIGTTFIGGSGRGLVTTPNVAGTSLWTAQVMQAGAPGQWHSGGYTLDVAAETISDDAGTWLIYDDTGTCPVGQWIHHDGRTVAGLGEFYVDVAEEVSGGGAIPDASVLVSAGTAQSGAYEATTSAHYVSSTDSDWTIEISADGSAELLFETTPIATRAAGACAWLPDGFYEATAAGMAAYNLTDAEPVIGETFNVFISSASRLPREGYVYLQITEAAGVLTAAEGPFFAATLPTDTSTVFHVPLAHCDGTKIEQFHTGLLIWPEAGGAAELTQVNLVTLSSDAYDELDPPDPDTIYDIDDSYDIPDGVILGDAALLDVGTTAGTVAAGDHTHAAPTWSEVSDKPSTFAPVVGTGATDAAAGNHTHAAPTWSEVSGKPSTFAPIIGTGATDAAAGNHAHDPPATYSPVEVVRGTMTAGRVAAKCAFISTGLITYVSGATTQVGNVCVFYLTAADFPTINGKATKLRVKGEVHCNDVQPHASMTFEFGLYPVTRPSTSGGAANAIYTLGTVVTGSTATVSAPAADSSTSAIGTDFDIPADGWYAIGLVTNQTFATSSYVNMRAELQRRNA